MSTTKPPRDTKSPRHSFLAVKKTQLNKKRIEELENNIAQLKKNIAGNKVAQKKVIRRCAKIRTELWVQENSGRAEMESLEASVSRLWSYRNVDRLI